MATRTPHQAAPMATISPQRFTAATTFGSPPPVKSVTASSHLDSTQITGTRSKLTYPERHDLLS